MIENGMMVTLKKTYHDDPHEVFKLSQVNGTRAWAGDRQGNGWYIDEHQIDLILGINEDATEDCEDCQGQCYLESDDGTQWVICSECDGTGGYIDDEYDYSTQKNFD